MKIGKIKGLWFALTSRNFILIHHINRGINKKGQKTITLATLRRTDFPDESDFLAMKGGIFNAFPQSYI